MQVPANGDHPSHAIASEVALESPFADHMGEAQLAQTGSVCSPERYAELLHEIGFAPQLVRLQVYGHELASSAAVVEWTRGTTLLRFQNQMPPEVFDQFLARYGERLLDVIGRRAPYFYTFKRILFWGRLGDTAATIRPSSPKRAGARLTETARDGGLSAGEAAVGRRPSSSSACPFRRDRR